MAKSPATKADATGRRRRRPGASPAAVPAGRAVEREAMIAEAAYFRAEARGFEAGHELADWLAAERDVDRLLEAEHRSDR
jgi:choline dehydrogenase-like flavoprotein